MKPILLGAMIVVLGATAAAAQYRDYDYRERGRWGGERCLVEKRDAQGHYRRAMRYKGFLDAGEERIQQQLQARYEACLYGRRRY